MKLLSFDQYFEKSLTDPKFKKAWEKASPAYQLSRQIIKNRLDQNMTQKELAQKVGTTQAIISKIENSNFNPSLKLLERISAGLNSPILLSIK